MNTAEKFYKANEEYIDKKFVDINTGKEYWYVGLLVGSDDYYYAMYSKEWGLVSLSCVGTISAHGFELVE